VIAISGAYCGNKWKIIISFENVLGETVIEVNSEKNKNVDPSKIILSLPFFLTRTSHKNSINKILSGETLS